MKITHALLGEHGALYSLLENAKQVATETQSTWHDLRQQAAILSSAVVAHASVEDALLRPALRNHVPAPSGPTDHEVIASAFGDVQAAADLAHTRSLLLHALAMTHEHFKKEEGMLFPLAERHLTDEEQEWLGAEWARVRRVFIDR